MHAHVRSGTATQLASLTDRPRRNIQDHARMIVHTKPGGQDSLRFLTQHGNFFCGVHCLLIGQERFYPCIYGSHGGFRDVHDVEGALPGLHDARPV